MVATGWKERALPNFSVEGEEFFDGLGKATVATAVAPAVAPASAEPVPERTEKVEQTRSSRFEDDAPGPETRQVPGRLKSRSCQERSVPVARRYPNLGVDHGCAAEARPCREVLGRLW